MPDRPLVYLTLAFAAGIIPAGWLTLPPGAALLTCGCLFIAAGVGYLASWTFNRWLFFAIFFFLGFSLATLAVAGIPPDLDRYTGHWTTIEGNVIREADIRSDRVYYLLDMDRVVLGPAVRVLRAPVLVRAPAAGPVYSYGDRLRLHGLFTRPQDAGNPGEFDYRAYLARQGIGAVFLVREPVAIRKLGVDGNPVLRAVLALKEKLLAVGRATLPPEQAALVNGIVFGTQGEIDRRTWQIFSESGVVHILSVSGLHVGLVLGAVLILAGVLRLPHAATAPAASAVLILYAILSGLGPAVIRSTVMALMLLWANHLGRERDWPTTLAAAALVCLFWHPLSLYDTGFQLSFAATWGILYLGPGLDRLFQRVMPMPAWLRGTLWVSLAAQLATLPLVALYYNLVSPVSLAANLVAVPLTGVIMALGAGASITGLVFPALGGIINAGTSLALTVFMGLITLAHKLPGGVIFVPTPPLALIVLWYGLLFLSVWLSTPAGRAAGAAWWRRHYRPAAAVLLGGAVILLAVSAHGYREKPLRIHFIDVGQGDSILVETPGGKYMLVDAGGWQGEFDSGEGAGNRVVVPYLRRLGVRRLDVLVLTHPHEDHAGGAAAVAKSLPVGLAVVSPFGFPAGPEQSLSTAAGTGAPAVPASPEANRAGRVSLATGNKAFPSVIAAAGNYRAGSGRSTGELSPAYAGLLSTLAARGVPVRPAAAGDRLRLDPALQINVLGPPRDIFQGTRSDANNNSVVLQISYGRQSILLTGDMEVEAQHALLDAGSVPACTVLKMPHHGSRYFLPAFLQAVHPAVTVISVGAYNNFGQPAPETLNLLEKTPARIYRTDLDGAVILTTDGKTWRVETGRRREAGGRTA